MNNIPMIFINLNRFLIKSDKRESAGTIVKKRNNSELYFLPARIRKMKTKKWYILNLSLIFLFLLNYVLYIPIINLSNAIYIYPIATIIVSLIGILLYIKMTYNYNGIENDLIYIGNDTESLKKYFDNLFTNEEIKFFHYNSKLFHREGRRAIYINNMFMTNISGSVNSKSKAYFGLFIAFTTSIVLVYGLSYIAVIIKGPIMIVFLPLVSIMSSFGALQIIALSKERLSQQIELINFLVDKYGKKENEK